jgi:hypothetical protein
MVYGACETCKFLIDGMTHVLCEERAESFLVFANKGTRRRTLTVRAERRLR